MASVLWRLLADLVVVTHVAYVSFVIIGEILILAGAVCRWGWVRNAVFRAAHLTAIGIVVLESWLGLTCPLTTWEQQFRANAGQQLAEGDFIARALDSLLFIDAPPAFFTVAYTLFGFLVILSLVLAPPRLSRSRKSPRSG